MKIGKLEVLNTPAAKRGNALVVQYPYSVCIISYPFKYNTQKQLFTEQFCENCLNLCFLDCRLYVLKTNSTHRPICVH